MRANGIVVLARRRVILLLILNLVIVDMIIQLFLAVHIKAAQLVERLEVRLVFLNLSRRL